MMYKNAASLIKGKRRFFIVVRKSYKCENLEIVSTSAAGLPMSKR